MSKKEYNVDDILAEIKRRKASKKAETTDAVPDKTPEPQTERIPRSRPEPHTAPKPAPPYVPPVRREAPLPKTAADRKPSARLEFGNSVPGLSKSKPVEPANVEALTGVKNPAKELANEARASRRGRAVSGLGTRIGAEGVKSAAKDLTETPSVRRAERGDSGFEPRQKSTEAKSATDALIDDARVRRRERTASRIQTRLSPESTGNADEAAKKSADKTAFAKRERSALKPTVASGTRRPPDTDVARGPDFSDGGNLDLYESPLADVSADEKPDEPTRVLPSMRVLKAADTKAPEFGKFAIEQEAYPDEDGGSNGAVIDYSEYNSAGDKRDVQRDIAHVKLWLFFRVTFTFILTAMLFIFTLSGRYESIPLPEALWPVPETMRAYLMACTVLLILISLVNSSGVGGGLIGLFRGHANSDTLAAAAILAAIGQGISAVANYESAEPSEMNLYFCAAALAMLFNGLGKMTMINRILSNFRLIASDGEPRKAVLSVDNDEFCHEFVKDASTRRPVIAYGVSAGFFSDFLALSYSDKYDVGINRAVAPVCLTGSVVVGVTTYFLTGSMLSAISAFCAVLCVCATLSSTFIENVPLSKLAKKLAPDGGMVSGNKAVESYCDTKALILTENDLFPKGNVRMHSIRAFSNNRIDEAILDAASVLCSVDGTLGPLFLEMIGGNKNLLKKVDNIIFENGMGVSAWVDQRRVLIGNRNLMVNHGVTLPAEATAHKHTRLSAEAEPLFLSNSGEACAQFTVSYHIDEELALRLDYLAARETLLIIKTMDANITPEKVWEAYGYPLELIRILPAEWHPRYNKMSVPRKTAPAGIVYPAASPAAFVRAISACAAARSSILSATVIQLIQIVMGYALVTFMAFMGSIGSISTIQICVYQLFWFIAIFITQKVRQS